MTKISEARYFESPRKFTFRPRDPNQLQKKLLKYLPPVSNVALPTIRISSWRISDYAIANLFLLSGKNFLDFSSKPYTFIMFF